MTIESVRAQFPALASGFAFLENAGGSQVPVHVMDRMRDLMVNGNVQTGAGYPASDYVDRVVAESKAFANVLMNGEGVGTTLVGPSTTDLVYRLAAAIGKTVKPGDEIVIGLTNHEANIGPWTRLESQGAVVKWWGVDAERGTYDYGELEGLFSTRTKVVAVAHTSNLLGDILDVKRVTSMAHSVGARVVVDGVANAPHAAPDVQALDADFYVLSLYKVFGPHIALMFGKHSAWEDLDGPNHFFFAKQMPYKFELGCQPYEALAGLLGTADYLAWLGGGAGHSRPTVERAYAVIKEFERPVLERLMNYLATKSAIRLVGPLSCDQSERHPTISFVHRSKPSDEVVRQLNGPDLGVRFGHMYAHRLCEALGAPTETGFVRISAVHYNTPEEATRLIARLEKSI